MKQLITYEARRGRENLEELKKQDFKVFEDPVMKFKHIKHCKSEKDKNHREGTNSKNYGVIPFITFSDGFNPGVLFEFYLESIPDEKDGCKVEGGYLFPRPRQASRKFDINDPSQAMYEPNMKGNFFNSPVYFNE